MSLSVLFYSENGPASSRLYNLMKESNIIDTNYINVNNKELASRLLNNGIDELPAMFILDKNGDISSFCGKDCYLYFDDMLTAKLDNDKKYKLQSQPYVPDPRPRLTSQVEVPAIQEMNNMNSKMQKLDKNKSIDYNKKYDFNNDDSFIKPNTILIDENQDYPDDVKIMKKITQKSEKVDISMQKHFEEMEKRANYQKEMEKEKFDDTNAQLI